MLHFDQAQILFQELLNTGKLPLILAEKLAFLQNCLKGNLNGQYRSISLEDQQALLSMTQNEKKYLFCEILQTTSSIAIGLKSLFEGQIDIQTRTLKQWKTKRFIIDISKQTLEIIRKNKAGKKTKKQRLINLLNYSLEVKDIRDKRNRFNLKAKQYKPSDGYYKSLACGTADLELYNKIIHTILNLSKLSQELGAYQIENQALYQDEVETYRLQQPDKVDDDKQVLVIDIQPDILSNPGSEQIIADKPEIVIQDKSEPLQEQVNMRETIEVQKPNPPKLIISSPTPRLSVQEITQTPSKTSKLIQYPLLIQNLADDGKLNGTYFSSTMRLFNQVYLNDGIQILQSKGLCFRAILSLPYDIERIFQALAEIEFMKKWNAVIAKESRFVSFMGSERSGIVYQKHRQYGLLYLPRDFVFLRYFYKRDQSWMVIDKSVEHDEVGQYFKVIRGEINYQIIELNPQGDNIHITIEVEMTNGGLSSQAQDSAITLQYLSELRNLSQFLKNYQFQPIIETAFLQGMQSEQQTFTFQESIPEVAIMPEEKSLETLPQIASEPQKIEQLENIDEVSLYNKIEDDEVLPQQNEFTPEEIIQNTLPSLTQEEQQKVRKMIAIVDQEKYFSFCLQYKYQQDPVNCVAELIESIDDGHYFLRQDWKRDKRNGGILFINNKKIDAQKRVIKFMLRAIGSNLLSGKSILSISLPVEVFETRSNLERFAYAFGFAPQFLEEGAKCSTPQEQMKHTLTFGLSSIIMYLSLEKPFNPILGETYQGIINGCPVYCEQISHHPPVCAFQLKGRGYCIDGHIESAAVMHANSVTGKNIGYIRVTYYNTGAKQLFIQCPGSIHGTAFGARVFNLAGKQFGIDLENQVVADLTFNPRGSLFGKKEMLQDQFIGSVYNVNKQAIYRYRKEGYVKYSGLDLKVDIESKLYNVSGVWNEYMIIEDIETFNLQMLPHRMVHHPNPLPSDSNYRTDILYWKLKDFDNAQRSKEILEIKQRNDRKLREKYRN